MAAVNNDGELPIDIAETEAMEELLDRETQLRGSIFKKYIYIYISIFKLFLVL